MSHDPPYAGKKLTAKKVHDLSRAQEYNPELTADTTDPDLGDGGTATGAYHRGGHLVSLWARFRFGGSGIDAGSGNYHISVDIDIDTSLISDSANPRGAHHVGSGLVIDGDGDVHPVSVYVASASQLRMIGESGPIDAALIGTPDSDTSIGVFAVYPADPSEL